MHECNCKVGDVVYSKNMRCLVILWSDRVCDWKNKIKQTLGALLTSSRVVNSVEERIRKKRSRLRPLIGVIKFMTNGKERVVIRVGCVICAGGGGALRVSAARRTGRVNYWSPPQEASISIHYSYHTTITYCRRYCPLITDPPLIYL